MPLSHRHRAQLLLLSVAAVWGAAFIAQRLATGAMGPHTFNALRFSIGCLVLSPWIYQHRQYFNLSMLKRGATLGVLLFLGSATQQIGMQYTSAGKGGFITSLYIVLVPIFSRFLFREGVSVLAWLGALVCCVGLYLLAVQEDFSLSLGDAWVLACAILFALHIALAGRFVSNFDPLALAAVQYMTAILCGLPVALLTETIIPTQILAAWPTYVYAGALSTGYGYTVQLLAQRHAGSTEAGIILGLESLFAAIFGMLLLHETMSNIQILGCALILLGTTLAQIQLKSLSIPRAKVSRQQT
ncbi:MAG: DMT family transporter [Oligoflexia bacterium]|nr:DMT family transporter [Oligoflexia bacterium]